jgi:xanthine/uracil/vitamin C permease (AzgA family)
MTIFAFSLSDTFDTIGTFIGTGRRKQASSQLKTKRRWRVKLWL